MAGEIRVAGRRVVREEFPDIGSLVEGEGLGKRGGGRLEEEG
ncbi:hypothetical protein [Methanocalculus sp. MC3]